MIEVSGLLHARVQFSDAIKYYIDLTPRRGKRKKVKKLLLLFLIQESEKAKKEGLLKKRKGILMIFLNNHSFFNFKDLIRVYICYMKIDIISVVPATHGKFLCPFHIKKGQEKVEVNIFNLRDYTKYKHGRVDDYQFGGGAGLVKYGRTFGRMQLKHCSNHFIR